MKSIRCRASLFSSHGTYLDRSVRADSLRWDRGAFWSEVRVNEARVLEQLDDVIERAAPSEFPGLVVALSAALLGAVGPSGLIS